MTRPKTPFEAASYDLNKFRERRMAERRTLPRDTADRRALPNGKDAARTRSESNADGEADTGDAD